MSSGTRSQFGPAGFRFRRGLGLAAAALIAWAAAVGLPARGPRPIKPVAGEVEPFSRDSFAEGAFATDPAKLPHGLKARGSWRGGDGFRGTFVTGWYAAHGKVALMVAGSPAGPGNALVLEIRMAGGSIRRLPFAGANPYESWRPWRVALPRGATAFRVAAVDDSTSFRGWLALSEPFEPDWNLPYASPACQPLVAFAAQALLFGTLTLALAGLIPARFGLPPWFGAIGAAAGAAILGYAAFWLYFISLPLGRIYSWLLLSASAGRLLWAKRGGDKLECGTPLALAAIVGVGAVALACLFDGGTFSFIAANRFLPGMPADNQIPAMFADRLWSGQSPRHLLGDWLSSDRPPLQAGWLLLTRPVMVGLGLDLDVSSSAGGVCFQLLWVPALWAVLRRLGARPKQAAAVIAALSFTGFFLFFTVFTWPKLGAAALVLGAFTIWWSEPDVMMQGSRVGTGVPPVRLRPATPRQVRSLRTSLEFARTGGTPVPTFALGGACAALGWLAHGGVAFSLIGLIPLILISVARDRRLTRRWLAAGAVFAALALSWFAYQKFYEPPGNRLLKWHLAGAVAPDARSFGAALVENYRKIGWRGALENRRINLRIQWEGDWRKLAAFHPRGFLTATRWEELTYSAYTFAWWLPAGLVLPWFMWRQRRKGDALPIRMLAWLILGWGAWLALMFQYNQAVVHQGTLLTQLLGFALLAWSALAAHRFLFLALAALQAAHFLEVWIAGTPAISGAVDPYAATVAAAAGATLALLVVMGSRAQNSPP